MELSSHMIMIIEKKEKDRAGRIRKIEESGSNACRTAEYLSSRWFPMLADIRRSLIGRANSRR